MLKSCLEVQVSARALLPVIPSYQNKGAQLVGQGTVVGAKHKEFMAS
jgi:hypothetical protein